MVANYYLKINNKFLKIYTLYYKNTYNCHFSGVNNQYRANASTKEQIRLCHFHIT